MIGQKHPEKNTKSKEYFVLASWKKPKKTIFSSLDVNSVLDNRKFWQNVKPLFLKKVKTKTTIKLIENDETIDIEIKIAKIFNKYFVNTVKNLGILTEKESSTFTEIIWMKWKWLLKNPKTTLAQMQLLSEGKILVTLFSVSVSSHMTIL